MGWHIARDGKSRWHNGMTGGYASWISVVPEKKVGVVVLANTAAEKVTELGEMVTRVALGEKVEPPAEPKLWKSHRKFCSFMLDITLSCRRLG